LSSWPPNNFAFGMGTPPPLVSVNSAFMDTGEAIVAPATGTQYDGATQRLRVQRSVTTSGSHALYLSIFDAGDGILDSAAFIDNLSVFNVADTELCRAGANRMPVAANDALTVLEDSTSGSANTVNVLANGSDADNGRR